MHWWYLPDSYDEHIALNVAPTEIQLDHAPVGPWRVYFRWVDKVRMACMMGKRCACIRLLAWSMPQRLLNNKLA